MPVPATPTTTQRTALSEEAFSSISRAILDGTLEPGERLRDEELTTWLGISRTPVRQALSRLEELGLVETARNRYTRVSEVDMDEMRQAVCLLGELTRGAIPRAFAQLDDAGAHRLIAVIEDLLADSDDAIAIPGGSHHGFRTLTLLFAELEGNTLRAQTMETMYLRMLRWFPGRERLDDAVVNPFLVELRDAVEARDPDAAIAVMCSIYDGPLTTLFQLERCALAPR